jgi:LysR family transcriptional regulator, low CO2-responsive transcriptional regulator
MVDSEFPKGLARLGTLRQLEIFMTVADVGGIAQAAEKLHLAQPSVSIQVRKLAEAVGMPLYDIVGRRLYLTEAGQRVVEAGRELHDTLERLDGSLNDLKGLQAGRLRLAVDSSAKYFLPQLLAPFLARHSGVELEFTEGKRSDLLKRLGDNKDDLYIFNHVPADMDIHHHPFLPNPLVVAARVDHPLAKRRKLQWQDLAQELLIVREEGSGSRLALDEFLSQQGLSIARSLALASSEAIRLSIMANMGVGVMSAYALVNAEADGLVQLRVQGFPIMSQWNVIYLRQKQLSRVSRGFLDFMLEEAESHLPMEKIRERVTRASH